MDFKVRCISAHRNNFVVGKTYKVTNGVLVSERGRNEDAGSTIKEVNENMISQFELVTDRPRICEVLGVEVGEKFDFLDEGGTMQFKGFYVNENGNIVTAGNHGMSSQTRLEALINGKIKIVRTPQFSEDEKALMRLYVGAGYPIFKPNAFNPYITAWEKSEIHGRALPDGLLLQITDKFNAAEYLEGLK